jgi:nucleoside-diphosphate-sugar epimerase
MLFRDIKNPSEEFRSAVKESISIIDASGTDADLLQFVLELNKAVKNRNYQHQYISTSGLLVYPDSATFASERTPPVIPPDFPMPQLAERARDEELLVTSDHVRGNIIRPGVVYGLDGNTGGNLPRHLVRVFGLKPNDELVIYGQRQKEVGWVHVKDLAAAYVLLVNSGAHGKASDCSRS